jgi:hypothetical protein
MTTPSDPVIFSSAELEALVRQHAHDVRNDLNYIEVELALLAEAPDPEDIRESITRLRRAVAHADAIMRSLSAKLIAQEPSLVSAADLVEQWNADALAIVRDAPLRWEMNLQDALHKIEVRVIRNVLSDMLLLVSGVYPHHPIRIAGWIEDGRIRYQITPEQAPPRRITFEETERLHWSALLRLVQRNHGKLIPEVLASTETLTACLEIPIHQLNKP